jgi:hypothetical protein
MKTAVRILLTLALPGLLGCATRPPSTPETAPRPPAQGMAALDILRQREPEVKWDPASLIEADLDQDGTRDYALTGTRGDLLVVGIVHGPVKDSCRHWTLEFPMDGTQDALCSREARIDLEKATPTLSKDATASAVTS